MHTQRSHLAERFIRSIKKKWHHTTIVIILQKKEKCNKKFEAIVRWITNIILIIIKIMWGPTYICWVLLVTFRTTMRFISVIFICCYSFIRILEFFLNSFHLFCCWRCFFFVLFVWAHTHTLTRKYNRGSFNLEMSSTQTLNSYHESWKLNEMAIFFSLFSSQLFTKCSFLCNWIQYLMHSLFNYNRIILIHFRNALGIFRFWYVSGNGRKCEYNTLFWKKF